MTPALTTARARVSERLGAISSMVSAGDTGGVRAALREGLWSSADWYGLRKDLTIHHDVPESRIPITVRRATDDDFEVLLGGDGEDARLVRYQQRVVASGIPTCWVAVTNTAEPCFMQWMIAPTSNDQLRAVFGPEFPLLEPHQILMEAAFTPNRFRGQRIAARAISLITEQAPEGATEAWTYVKGLDSPDRPRPSTRAGFRPAVRKTKRWRFGIKRIEFEPLESSTVDS